MTKFTMKTGDGKFEEVVIDLLVDILASNLDIKERLDAIYDFEVDGDGNHNRELIIEYLKGKHGELPESLSSFLKSKNINKPNK